MNIDELKWVCLHCKTENNNNLMQCSSCGKNRYTSYTEVKNKELINEIQQNINHINQQTNTRKKGKENHFIHKFVSFVILATLLVSVFFMFNMFNNKTYSNIGLPDINTNLFDNATTDYDVKIQKYLEKVGEQKVVVGSRQSDDGTWEQIFKTIPIFEERYREVKIPRNNKSSGDIVK